MKIKFLQDAKYPQNDPLQSREYKAGEVHDVPPDHARRWIRRNAAVEVDEPKKRGKAESSTVEAMVPASPAKPIAKSESV